MGNGRTGNAAVCLCSLAASRCTSAMRSSPARAARPLAAAAAHHRVLGARRQGLPVVSCSSSSSRDRRSYATRVDKADKASIAVVGGGLTGLTTAYYLAKRLPPTAKITLYESSNRLGGWIDTERVEVDVLDKQGMVNFERGPRSMVSLSMNTWRYDDLVLWQLAVELGLTVYDVPDKPRYLYALDRLIELPRSILSSLQEPLIWKLAPSLLSFYYREWQRMNEPPTIPEEDMSIAQWLQTLTQGSSVGDLMASAVAHGVHGGDIDKLSARSAFPEQYYGSIARHLKRGAPPNAFLCLPEERKFLDEMQKDQMLHRFTRRDMGPGLFFGPHGMEVLPKALAEALRAQPNVEIKLNEPIRSMRYEPRLQKVEVKTVKSRNFSLAYDKVISTVSSHDLADMTGEKVPALAKTHSVSIMTVNLWYPFADMKPYGTGYLVPRAVPLKDNPTRALGVFFDSDQDQCAGDEVSGTKLFVLMGGHYYDNEINPPDTEEEAISQAKYVVERHLKIPPETPCFAMARMAKNCIPQHLVGHQDLMRQVDTQLATAFGGRLGVAGGSYHRIGVLGALRAGYDAAARTAGDGFLETGASQPAVRNAESLLNTDLPFHPVRNIPKIIVHKL